ncbi:hypothetical protein A2U01_0049469, partial [Trifolium medium]|nr:hypothetical protein [Trifolium medium]
KSYTEGFALIESITANTYQWPTGRLNSGPDKKRAGVLELSESTAISAQIAQLSNMMKHFMATPAKTEDAPEPVQVVADSSVVACVYCGGAHLFEDCSANPVSANYVGNYGKSINPYSNTYNPGWGITPIQSYANQGQQRQQAPAVPPGFPPANNSQLESIIK